MTLKTLALGALALGTAAGLGGCTDGYGYGGVGYASDGYYGAGYGYGAPYWGWYGGYYYPGSGIYVYDQYRRPYRWNGAQQRYWQGRYGNYLRNCQGATCRQDRREVRQNWQDFRGDVRQDRRDYRGDVRDARQDYRQGDITRQQYRDQRQDARQDFRQDYRQDRRQYNRANRQDIGPRPHAFGGARATGAARTGGAHAGGGGGHRGPGN